TKPDSFDRYLIASPSIMWANKDILNLEEKYSTEHTDMDKYLYFGVGGNEGYMVDDMQEMIQQLSSRGYPNLKLLQDVYPDAGHIQAGTLGSWNGRKTLANEALMTLPQWSNSQVYTKDQQVQYLGHIYKAKWWTKNQTPSTSTKYGVWVKVR
ncbi:MAG: carbohydrate-binding protein, partial [Psychrosphaera sp.]|nr:carbohydrate-binding protein [Psychrosphaera sp.]